jgi:hypothetical protein
MGGLEAEAWKYLATALPTACIAGPLGALLASHCHRLVYATTCYILDTTALASGPWLPDFSWHNIPKRGKIYQMTTTLPNGL